MVHRSNTSFTCTSRQINAYVAIIFHLIEADSFSVVIAEATYINDILNKMKKHSQF